MTIEQQEQDELAAMARGGLFGAVCGALLGAVVAWATGTLYTFVGIFLIFHIALAMLMTGTWTCPTILSRHRNASKQVDDIGT